MNPAANYEMTLDPASVARIARLVQADVRMREFYLAAMRYSVSLVLGKAQANAADGRFVNPTGNLLQNITGYVASWDVGVVGVTRSVPYARRREFGFTGRTDSLGRHYTNDPGAFYLRDALTDSQPEIATAFGAATTLAIRNIALP